MVKNVMMKKGRVLVYVIVFSLVVNWFPMTFYANERGYAQNYRNSKKEEKLIEDDTIVCYYKGYPITKAQVGEDNVIDANVIDMIEVKVAQTVALVDNEISTRSVLKDPMLEGGSSSGNRITRSEPIPSGYSEAIVEVLLTTTGFSQTTKSMYFTRENAIKFADGIVYGNAATIVAMLAGFIPIVGPVITVGCTIDSLRKGNIAAEIRTYTDKGYKVRVDKIMTKYATYYVVDKWTTNSVYYTTYKEGPTTQKLVGISFK